MATNCTRAGTARKMTSSRFLPRAHRAPEHLDIPSLMMQRRPPKPADSSNLQESISEGQAGSRAQSSKATADPGAFFIKPSYRPNLTSASLRQAASAAYWNPDLVTASCNYQFDVYRLATRIFRRRPGQALLDVGCGPPSKLRALLGGDFAHATLVDQPSVQPFAKKLMPLCRFVATDLETIDLDLGQRYDVIVCADVVEHLLNPNACLRFLRRHLALDGTLLISTPERDIQWGSDCNRSPNPDHVREWSRVELRSYLESRGFVVIAQRLLAKKRYRAGKRWLGAVLSSIGMPPSWYSCQVALCQVASDAPDYGLE